ncbi:MAG TPA: MFS transporter [Acidimicrobiales bacterium]|nr:MFS transporter [Acidimicrobiales bacterium]
MARVVTRSTGGRAEVERWLQPRRDIVAEVATGDGRFEAEAGPVTDYRRTVEVTDLGDGQLQVTSTTDFRLSVPYVGWLFVWPVRRHLAGPPRTDGSRQPWWAPPDRLDARAASVLGLLVAISLVAGYLGTLISQTITYAASEFGVDSRGQGTTLASIRIGVLLALVLVAVADRRGRRMVLLGCAAGGCIFAAAGALAPSMAWLGATQLVSRAFSTALALLISIVAVEEMPKGARAYAVSVLGMAAALGAGLCIMALPLADLGEQGWRLLYFGPLLGLPLVRGVARSLPESRRFGLPHAATTMRGHRSRLALLAVSALLLALFTAPASQFQNEFLRVERDFSAARITLFTLLTNTPGGIGVIVGGRLADVRGRRLVGAVGLAGGVGATVLMYLSGGWPLWAWSVVGAVVGGAVVPALGVYGPELFPTSLRGRANGTLAISAVLGSSLGLLLAGHLADRFGGFGPALAVLSLGSVVVVVLVLTLYPETAHQSLEELNPEDVPPPSLGGLGG